MPPKKKTFNHAARVAADDDDVRAFHRIAAEGSKDEMKRALVKYAEKYGDDIIDAVDKEGRTAFMKAAETSHTPTMAVLLEAGAEIDGRDYNGNTALLIAAHRGYKSAVLWLLDKGADLKASNYSGETALMKAGHHKVNLDGKSPISNRKKDTVEALLERGVSVDAVDRSGKTAEQLAEATGHRSVAGIIRRERDARMLREKARAATINDVVHSLTVGGVNRDVRMKPMRFKPPGNSSNTP
ncbi:MAG: ankyrin repeat domain-containing protein [Micavibrio sp.]|nr:ankyrin repeat domain-containing protein [Micavibrio sp.]